MILVKRVTCHCMGCEHPISAMTDAALVAAIDAHTGYVDLTADRETDPHYEAQRLDALISA